MEEGVRDLLKKFQEGYSARDLENLDGFMNLFCEDAEIIGTNGSFPGKDEWYLDREGARKLVSGDWEDWGDVALDFSEARIKVKDSFGWVSIPAKVTKHIGEENYQSYLEYVREYIETPDIPAKQKLHNILRGGTNTVFELNRGEEFVWPVRITAVVREDNQEWKFVQIHFSFSTIYFPDVRILEK